MPWLEREKVFFVHVPRCAGTSITRLHKVRQKAISGQNIYYKYGLNYFFYRYYLLERSNFPYISVENGIASLQFTIGTILFLFFRSDTYPLWLVLWIISSITFISSTFILSAPVLARSRPLRRFYQLVIGKWAKEWMGSRYMVTGCGADGWYIHFTAEKVIRYGLVPKNEMKEKSFAIVRNPYSRMVSIYLYNKLFFETFDSFCSRFYKEYEIYETTGTTEDWDIYCHALPMHAYTHSNGEQLVSAIIKQEDFKKILHLSEDQKKDVTIADIPKVFLDSLINVPHANSRSKSKPWQEYYTQESMDIVLKMFGKDFEIFNYSTMIPGRSDLIPSIYIANTSTLAADHAFDSTSANESDDSDSFSLSDDSEN